MTIIQTTLLQRMHRCSKMTLEWKHAAVNPTRTDAVRRDQEGQEAFGGLPGQLDQWGLRGQALEKPGQPGQLARQEIRELTERLGRLGLAVLPEQQELPAHPA